MWCCCFAAQLAVYCVFVKKCTVSKVGLGSRPRVDPSLLSRIILRHILGICAKIMRLMLFLDNMPNLFCGQHAYGSKYW
jgi:hypothetical protein